MAVETKFNLIKKLSTKTALLFRLSFIIFRGLVRLSTICAKLVVTMTLLKHWSYEDHGLAIGIGCRKSIPEGATTNISIPRAGGIQNLVLSSALCRRLCKRP